MKHYRDYAPDQLLILPPSLRDWLPERHLAHLISDTVDPLDLSRIAGEYEDNPQGYPPYQPNHLWLQEHGIEGFIPPDKVKHSDWRVARPPRGSYWLAS